MQKIIFILYGGGNNGKTSSLSMLIEMLQNLPITNPKEDNRTVVKYRGYNIAITTWGDYNEEEQENVDFLEEKSWDIAVVATRTWGETCEIIRKYARKINAMLIRSRKYPNENDIDGSNLQTTVMLCHKIDTIISKWNGTLCPSFFAEPNSSSDGTFVVSIMAHNQQEGGKQIRVQNMVYPTLKEAENRVMELNDVFFKELNPWFQDQS